MDGHTVYLVGKELGELTSTINVVPEAHALVSADGDDKGLADGDVHAGDGPLVIVGTHDIKVHLIGLHDLAVAQEEGVELVVLQGAEEVLLVRGDCEVPENKWSYQTIVQNQLSAQNGITVKHKELQIF